MEEALISIIIPVYNVEKYLDRCISSVLNQTYQNLQIILVDDGSTDGSSDICDKYKAMDTGISVIHKKNGGAADARNRGLQIAEGEYVGFVDADDYIARDMYECLYEELKRRGCDIACCGRVNRYDKKAKLKSWVDYTKKQATYLNNEEAMRALLLYDDIDFSPCDKLFSFNVLKNICFPVGRSSEDIPVIYEAFKRSNGVVHIGAAKYNYCHRKGSSTGRGFYPRRMDYFYFIRDIYRDVIMNYSILSKEAEVMLQRALIVMWNDIKEANKISGSYILLEKRMKKLMIRSLPRYILNPYVSRNEYIKVLKGVVNCKWDNHCA